MPLPAQPKFYYQSSWLQEWSKHLAGNLTPGKISILAIALSGFLIPMNVGADTEVVMEAYAESSGHFEASDETSVGGGGYTSVGHAWVRENDYEIRYGTGCRVSLDTFAGYDWVIVSSNGTDPDIPSGETVLYLAIEDYYCLFPMDPKEVTFRDPVSAFLEDPELQGEIANATLAGNATQVMNWFLPNLTLLQDEFLDQSYTVSGPGATLGFRPNITTWNEVTGYHNVTAEDSTFNPNVTINPQKTIDEATPPPGPLSPSASGSGWMTVRVILPKRYTYNSDGSRWEFYPSGGCNQQHYREAFASLRQQFPKPSSSVRLSVNLECIIKYPHQWDPCKPVGGGSNYCTRNTQTLLDRLVSHTNQWSWMTDGNNELVTTVVNSADNNGIGSQPGDYSLLAERANWKPDSPHTSILIHEFGHNFGASHVPDNGWFKNLCRTWHQHAWNYGHWHEHDTVMNYCHMYWGWKTFDHPNWVTVRDSIW